MRGTKWKWGPVVRVVADKRREKYGMILLGLLRFIYIYRQARDDMSMSNAKYATYCCGMSLDIVA